MYLPQTGDEFCQMLHHLVFVQRRIIKLPLLAQVVFYGRSQILPASIKHRVASQYPLLFRDVVFAKTAGVLENAFENCAMNSRQSGHAVSESIGLKKLRDVARHAVGLFLKGIALVVVGFAGVVLGHHLAHFVDGDFAQNISDGGLLQITGGLQSIYSLQANRHTPSLRPLFLLGLSLTYILVEVNILYVVAHIQIAIGVMPERGLFQAEEKGCGDAYGHTGGRGERIAALG